MGAVQSCRRETPTLIVCRLPDWASGVMVRRRKALLTGPLPSGMLDAGAEANKRYGAPALCHTLHVCNTGELSNGSGSPRDR